MLRYRLAPGAPYPAWCRSLHDQHREFETAHFVLVTNIPPSASGLGILVLGAVVAVDFYVVVRQVAAPRLTHGSSILQLH